MEARSTHHRVTLRARGLRRWLATTGLFAASLWLLLACAAEPPPSSSGAPATTVASDVPAPAADVPAGNGAAGSVALGERGDAVTAPPGQDRDVPDLGPTTTIDPTSADPVTGEPPPLALDECDLNSGWLGDENCILPPPPDRGFRIRVGPADYDNPSPEYVLEPGQETNLTFDVVSGNDRAVHYYYRQYRLRPGTHHLVLTEKRAGLGLDSGSGRRLGGSQNLIKDMPDRGIIAPENAGVGVPLEPRVTIAANLHYINTTDQPLIQEAWVNFWYKDDAEVTERATEMFLMGSVSFAVQPFSETTLGPYGCNVTGSGRVLSLYGHRHAHAPRFTAWRVRGGERALIYESLDWAEPMVLEFNSLVSNVASDRAASVEGGHSGILDLAPGDRLEWECHVVNPSDQVLRFSNQTFEGEMCILIGDTVGTPVSCAPGL